MALDGSWVTVMCARKPKIRRKKFIQMIRMDKSTSQKRVTHPNYHIYLAVRLGFSLSRRTKNNYISPLKFCYTTSFSLPKQPQRSRSILQDTFRSRFLELFWQEKTLSYNQRNMVFSYKTCLPFLNHCKYVYQFCAIKWKTSFP